MRARRSRQVHLRQAPLRFHPRPRGRSSRTPHDTGDHECVAVSARVIPGLFCYGTLGMQELSLETASSSRCSRPSASSGRSRPRWRRRWWRSASRGPRSSGRRPTARPNARALAALAADPEPTAFTFRFVVDASRCWPWAGWPARPRWRWRRRSRWWPARSRRWPPGCCSSRPGRWDGGWGRRTARGWRWRWRAPSARCASAPAPALPPGRARHRTPRALRHAPAPARRDGAGAAGVRARPRRQQRDQRAHPSRVRVRREGGARRDGPAHRPGGGGDRHAGAGDHPAAGRGGALAHAGVPGRPGPHRGRRCTRATWSRSWSTRS